MSDWPMEAGIYRNEFAAVEVRKDESANGVRLLIRDLLSGRAIYLDPLQLEALTWMDPRQFAALLDPSWRTEAEHEQQEAERSDAAWEAEQVLREQQARNSSASDG